MARLAFWVAAVIAVSFGLHRTARAAEALPDRSTLSYDENVTINTACFSASQDGHSYYERCVQAQIAALQKHPTPDRSGLSTARNRRIESVCAFQRRVGIGQYNDCLKKAMAEPGPESATINDPLSPNVARVFSLGPDRPKKPEATPASLPAPQKVLPKRPSRIDRAILSPADVFKKVEHSVFVVYATPSMADARARNVMFGSAVAVSEHFLLTNCHVVADRPVIRIMRDEKPMVATLVAGDLKADRCILKSEGAPLAPVAGVRPFKDLAVGERVFAIGTPIGFDRTLTQGLISGLRNFDGRNLVQTDAPLSPGNSGGGLFDESGNLIGITTLASRAGIQNLNFAVAASDYWGE
jgi:Trypsin-like peptidase domain